jgi:hypothetical protein
MNEYHVVNGGRDQQLETAVQVLLRQLQGQ